MTRETVPPLIDQKMYDILAAVAEGLFASWADAVSVVKRHVWRNVDYVGTIENQVQAWYGWSANLRSLHAGYRTIYIDYLQNRLPEEYQKKLFGEVFANTLKLTQGGVFLFVTSCPYNHHSQVLQDGFTFRRINNTIHPGYFVKNEAFLGLSLHECVEKAHQLLRLQKSLQNFTSSNE